MNTRDLTVSDLCEELGLHANTVRRLIADGVIPAYRAGLRAWRVTRADLDSFKAQGGHRSADKIKQEAGKWQ